MFDSRHYVPILKWKRAEQGALATLGVEYKKYITPLFQFVMSKQKLDEQFEGVIQRFEEQIDQIPEKIIEVWGKDPAFIDVSLLYTTELKVKSLSGIIKKGYKAGIILIPIIHIDDEREIKNIACSSAIENGSSVCLRLICTDLDNLPKLNQKIIDLFSSTGLSEQDFHLLIDIKDTEKDGEKYIKYLDCSQKITNLLKWRTYTFASGSFPKDLSGCKIDEENLIPRLDWNNWVKQINSESLKREPAFSDYTIQYPIYREDTQFFPPTTSIKYTLENEWLIMKGEKQKFDKYLASAALLVEDKRFFYGEGFSSGDKFIFEKAKHFIIYMKNPAIKGTGSTETWLRAGINHHLAVVAHQVANLS